MQTEIKENTGKEKGNMGHGSGIETGHAMDGEKIALGKRSA